MVEGEETVGGDDSRLFTKIRLEFCKWGLEIENNFQRGECAPSPHSSIPHSSIPSAARPPLLRQHKAGGAGGAAAWLKRQGSCSVKDARHRKPRAV